jgi:rhamnogalacturonyl hydrolase YesR
MINNNFVKKYLLTNDLSSFDPYDIWKTKIGINTKKLYYKNKYLGLIPAGLLTMYDLYINNNLRLGYKKQEFPIVRAQAVLSLLNLYKLEPKNNYLEYAKKHIDWLLNNSSKGHSGYCWGLNFNWQYSKSNMYDKNTPFSTHTPYPLEALIEYYKITKDSNLIEPIKSILLFLEKDLKIMEENNNILIISYGVQKDRIVANSNSYVMYMYSLLLEFFPEKKDYIENKIYKIYNFLKSIQNKDGSWLYSPYENSTFIDCFHSCFILKNILKSNSILKLNNSSEIVKKGYDFLINNFLDKDYFLFRRFYKSNKISLIKFDLYDNAELLNISKLLNDNKTYIKLQEAIEKSFVDKNNNIASTIDLTNNLKNRSHLRWAIMPYLLASTAQGVK